MKKQTFFILILSLFSLFSSELKSQNAKKDTIRVLTFNILHGATTRGDFDLERIAEVIRNASPDLVALQEVDYKTRRAKNYDLATELGLRVKMIPLFGAAMPYDGGFYGESILSKRPIISSRNVPLPHSPGNEPRTALEILTQLESGDTICFIGTHLEHQKHSSDRIDQVKKINNVWKDYRYPTILAGDLNDTPHSKPISILSHFWTDTFGENVEFTYPSDNPKVKIDYIMFRPLEKWEIQENKVICDKIASDHCAVLSVLILKN